SSATASGATTPDISSWPTSGLPVRSTASRTERRYSGVSTLPGTQLHDSHTQVPALRLEGHRQAVDPSLGSSVGHRAARLQHAALTAGQHQYPARSAQVAKGAPCHPK